LETFLVTFLGAAAFFEIFLTTFFEIALDFCAV